MAVLHNLAVQACHAANLIVTVFHEFSVISQEHDRAPKLCQLITVTAQVVLLSAEFRRQLEDLVKREGESEFPFHTLKHGKQFRPVFNDTGFYVPARSNAKL